MLNLLQKKPPQSTFYSMTTEQQIAEKEDLLTEMILLSARPTSSWVSTALKMVWQRSEQENIGRFAKALTFCSQYCFQKAFQSTTGAKLTPSVKRIVQTILRSSTRPLSILGTKSEEVSKGFLDCHKFLFLFFLFFFLFFALLLRRNLILRAKQRLQPRRVELQLLLLPANLFLLLQQCSPCMHLCWVPLTAAVRAGASEPVLLWKCCPLKRKAAVFTYRPK